MAKLFKVRKGNLAQAPRLQDSELGYTKDTNELLVGTQEGNKSVFSEKFDEINAQLADITKKKLQIVYPSGKTDDTDYNNIYAELSTHKYVKLGDGTFQLNKPLNMESSWTIEGSGINVTIIKSTHSDFAFVQSRSGTGSDEGVKLFDFSLLCNNGIKIGDINKDIVDGTSANPQPYIMRPYIQRVSIQNINNLKTGVGIEMVKCFNGKISECYIAYFQYGIHTKGCDIWDFTNNRVALSDILVWVESTAPSGTFGSQANISNNDLLGATTTFIKSSDRCINIFNNYMENTVVGNAEHSIIIDYGLYVRIHQNRIENITKTGSNTLFKTNSQYYIYYVGNGSNSANKGLGVKFEKPTALGYTYKYFTPIIIHHGNMHESGFPFESTKDYNYADGEKIVFSPSNGGNSAHINGVYQTGRYINAKNNAFVFKNAPNYSETVVFYPCNINNANANGDSGVLDPQIVARNTAYSIGSIIKPSANSNVFYTCITGGITSSNAPIYNECKDDTITDGTAVFSQIGLVATGTYKVTMTAYADYDNQEILLRFRQNLDVPISGQDKNITGIGKRKKTFVVHTGVTGTNIGVRINNTADTNMGNIYIENITFERID